MKNSKEKSSKKKIKRWQSMFEVRKWLHQLKHDTWQGKEGDWVESWTVLTISPDGLPGTPVTKRFYSDKGGAERGAAQIFNSIEKALLG